MTVNAGDNGLQQLHYRVESNFVGRGQSAAGQGAGHKSAGANQKPFSESLLPPRSDAADHRSVTAYGRSNGSSQSGPSNSRPGVTLQQPVPATFPGAKSPVHAHVGYGAVQSNRAGSMPATSVNSNGTMQSHGASQRSMNGNGHAIAPAFVHINQRTGRVRVRDYLGLIPNAVIAHLKTMAKRFSRNGRQES